MVFCGVVPEPRVPRTRRSEARASLLSYPETVPKEQRGRDDRDVQAIPPEPPTFDRATAQPYGHAMKHFHCDSAEWRPLEAIIPLDGCRDFMYMGCLEVDGQRLHHYKHGLTRRYLFVSDGLQTYRYVGGDEYVPEERARAIQHALDNLSELRPNAAQC